MALRRFIDLPGVRPAEDRAVSEKGYGPSPQLRAELDNIFQKNFGISRSDTEYKVPSHFYGRSWTNEDIAEIEKSVQPLRNLLIRTKSSGPKISYPSWNYWDGTSQTIGASH